MDHDKTKKNFFGIFDHRGDLRGSILRGAAAHEYLRPSLLGRGGVRRPRIWRRVRAAWHEGNTENLFYGKE